MFKATAIVGMGLLAGATVIFGQDAPWLKGTTDDKLKTLAAIQPGLGTVMIEYSNRAGNVYYAAQASNWGLAAYQLNEMTEIQEVAENTRPARAKALQSFEKSALGPLAKDIVNQDATVFRSDFARWSPNAMAATWQTGTASSSTNCRTGQLWLPKWT